MTGIRLATGTVALAAGLALTGCTATDQQLFRDPAVPAGSFQLVSFSSCDDALTKLKQAAKEYVGPYGFGSGGVGRAIDTAGGAVAVPGAAAADKATGAEAQGAPGYSGTNNHEAGVDEPDLVKTDGRRIVTVVRGVLHVVDPATKRVVGTLKLVSGEQDVAYWNDTNLLLAGDHALVLLPGGYGGYGGPGFVGDIKRVPSPADVTGPRIMLVDLTGTPKLLSTYTVDGMLVDARQVGSTVRVVTRSYPRLDFPYRENLTDGQRESANRQIIDKSTVDDWLPRYTRTDGGTTDKGRVNCEAVSRPAAYSGTSLMTLLTFDVGRTSLGSGEPLTVVADGEVVYSNGPSLYVANDQRWRAIAVRAADGSKTIVADEKTELYKFDTSGTGRPKYVASGVVPGYPVNQYALSEWDGHLRVATTTGQGFEPNGKSSSAVYVLAQKGSSLSEVGKVTGLGKGERIYSVRFVGPVGYVVTFRQVDPLYTVDLSTPTAPKLTGELKITGYSAYLHPVGAGLLLGIGQEASTEGRRLGTQVSLFDVSNLETPRRLAQYHVRYGNSEAEFDPHAFLFWPATGLLVVPLSVYQPNGGPEGVAMALRVTGSSISEVGTVTQPRIVNRGVGYPTQIRRALVVGDTLWTVSDAGLQANDLTTVAKTAWVPMT